jgi:hypothetical protein
MKPELDVEGLKKTKGWEYALRFAFGGIVTAGAALVTHAWGPSVGGLFLGFPAILPAGLTLVKEHDGRARAVDDARGGRLGSVALTAFALIVWQVAPRVPAAMTLAVAGAGWVAVSAFLWWLFHRNDAPSR